VKIYVAAVERCFLFSYLPCRNFGEFSKNKKGKIGRIYTRKNTIFPEVLRIVFFFKSENLLKKKHYNERAQEKCKTG
jgi:hypothetical protein